MGLVNSRRHFIRTLAIGGAGTAIAAGDSDGADKVPTPNVQDEKFYRVVTMDADMRILDRYATTLSDDQVTGRRIIGIRGTPKLSYGAMEELRRAMGKLGYGSEEWIVILVPDDVEFIKLEPTDADAAKEYFHKIHLWLREHPGLNSVGNIRVAMQDNLNIEVVKVCPETGVRENDEKLNTEVRIMLETGPWQSDSGGGRFDGYWTHDPMLDCSGETFEDAIIRLSQLVKQQYGDWRGS